MINFTFAQKPSLLRETAVLLYRHAVGITPRDMKKRFLHRCGGRLSPDIIASIEPLFDRLEDIERRVCDGIDKNYSFEYYFKDCGTDCSGEDSIALRCLATSVLLVFDNPMISDCHAQAEYLKKAWHEFCEFGYEFIIEKMVFEINAKPDADMRGNYLFSQIDKLPFSRDFLYKLYKAYIDYDRTVDELTEFMHPYAMKLKNELEALMPFYNSAMAHWRDVSENRTDGMLFRAFPYAGLSLNDDFDVFLNVSPVETCFSNMTLPLRRSGERTALFLCLGPDIRNECPYDDPDHPSEYIYNIMRLLSDSGKLKILNLLSTSESYCAELASNLGLDSGNVSRYLRMLSDMGFISGSKKGTRVFYRTNADAVITLMDCVTDYLLAGQLAAYRSKS